MRVSALPTLPPPKPLDEYVLTAPALDAAGHAGYVVIGVSLFAADIRRLDALLARLRREVDSAMSRSSAVRYALKVTAERLALVGDGDAPRAGP